MADLNPETTPEQTPQQRARAVRQAMWRERQKALQREATNEANRERTRIHNVAKVAEKSRQNRTRDAYHHCTPFERRFARIVASEPNCNRAEAARRAGYKGAPIQSRIMADSMFRRPIVRAAIWELVSAELDAAKIEGAQVIREAAYLAFLPAHMVEGKPTWRDKIESQKLLAALLGLEDRTVLHKHEHSYATLVHNAAQRGRKRLTVDVVPSEPTADVGEGQRETVGADIAGGGGPDTPLAQSPR